MTAPGSKYLIHLGLLLLLFSGLSFGRENFKEHTEIIKSESHEFTIEVGGTIDPENVEISIENTGDKPIVNPRITVNGKYNWYTLKGLVDEITRGCKTDEEKVMAIFQFVDRETYWWTYPRDYSEMNPIRHFNVYGYHICSDAAGELVALCRAAGVEARIWEVWHHTVAEAKWDGVWHHLDADLGMWYLKDDNKTIASIVDLDGHPEWVARTYEPYRWFLTPNDNRKVIYSLEVDPAGERMANIYDSMENNYIETAYDPWLYADHDMNLTLRQGEGISRWWKPVLHKYYDQKTTQEPPRYANGRIVFEPDFSKYTYDGLISRANLKYQVEDGKLPSVHVDRLHDRLNDKPSYLTIPMSSPYVIVGGYIDTEFYKGGTTSLDRMALALNLHPVFFTGTPLWSSYSWACGSAGCRAALDDKISRDGQDATYDFKAVYTIMANKENADVKAVYPLVYGGRSGLNRVRITTDLQVNPRSLPALSLGRNVIQYTDETDGPHEVKITYKWREISDQHLPEAPESATSPKDGSKIKGLTPKLEWSAASDVDGDRIVNYRVQVSLRPDCAWPVVSSLDRDVRSGTVFQVSKGWLNPKTTYYWRVRAEDEHGNFGPWSRISSFTTR